MMDGLKNGEEDGASPFYLIHFVPFLNESKDKTNKAITLKNINIKYWGWVIEY